MSIKMHFLANEIVGFVSTPIYFRCRRETWAEFVWIVSIVLAAVLEGTQFRELVDGWKDGFWCKSQSNLSALGKRRRVVMLAQPGEKARECLLIITGSKGPKDSTARACKGEGWKTLWILHSTCVGRLRYLLMRNLLVFSNSTPFCLMTNWSILVLLLSSWTRR